MRRCCHPCPAPKSARQQVQWPSGQLRGTWHRPDGCRCWRPLLQSPGQTGNTSSTACQALAGDPSLPPDWLVAVGAGQPRLARPPSQTPLCRESRSRVPSAQAALPVSASPGPSRRWGVGVTAPGQPCRPPPGRRTLQVHSRAACARGHEWLTGWPRAWRAGLRVRALSCALLQELLSPAHRLAAPEGAPGTGSRDSVWPCGRRPFCLRV